MNDFIFLFDTLYRRAIKAYRVFSLHRTMNRLARQINEAATRCDYRRVSALSKLYNSVHHDYSSLI